MASFTAMVLLFLLFDLLFCSLEYIANEKIE